MKGRFNFVIGFIIGAVIFGSTAAVAAGIVANRTTSKVFVNGTEVGVEAYNINGSNYFKLRDIGQAVDFEVIWDGASNRILIDTSKGYTPGESLPAPTPIPEPGLKPAMSIDEMKAEIIRMTNEERVRAGVPELAVLPALMDCAQTKADDMLASHYYGHNSPVYGTAGEMIRAAVTGAKAIAENLAPWTRTPEDAYAGWAESAPHLKNMLNPIYTHIGVGIIESVGGGYWWVQQFVSI